MSKKEKTVINEEEKLFLAEVVAASTSGNIVYCNPDLHKDLLSEKLIEVNFTLKNDEDCVAARATKKAIEYLAADSAAPMETSDVRRCTEAFVHVRRRSDQSPSIFS